MDIKKKMKMRMLLFVLYIIIGAAFCVLSFMNLTGEFIYILGAAFIVSGTVQLVRSIRLINNPEKLEERSVAEKDERNIMLNNKARSLAFVIYILAAAIAMVIMYILEIDIVGLTLSYSICGLVVIYWISYFILRKKY